MAKPFISVIVKPTLDCNLRCGHCYHRPEECGKEILSVDKFERLAGFLKKEYDSCRFIWHGGEPLLCGESFFSDVMKIEKKYFGEFGCDNTIQTNGTLLSKRFIEFCKKNCINLGISYEAGYDGGMRPGVDVSKMDSTLDYMVRKKHMFMVSATIHDGNVDDMKNIYHKFRDMGTTVAFNPLINLGCAADNKMTLDVDKYTDNCIELFDEWIFDKEVKVPLLPHYQYVLTALHGPNISDCPHSSCLSYWICMHPNGDLYPCGKACPGNYKMGNINEIESLSDAFDSDGFANILLPSIKRRDKCKGCEIYDYCNGGCTIDAMAEGKISCSGGFSCLHYKKFFSHIKETMDGIMEDKPDMRAYNGFIRDAIMGKLVNPPNMNVF